MGQDDGWDWGPPREYRPEGFKNTYLAEPHPGRVRDARLSHTIHGMLARKRGVGKTHELASFIQSAHMNDGFMVCFNSKEAQRVHRSYGIKVVGIDNYQSGHWYTQEIPFVDPEVLGTLMGHHDREMSEQEHHYLRRLHEAKKAAERAEAEAYRNRQVAIEVRDACQEGIAWAFLFSSMGKLDLSKDSE